ncbi:hypothetical protein [Gayadomonas joobiniege]|uniref:hypothetical protein n=1 Tax=Gayadomonas joobiniege TaxID=1234606 RepID=UPI000380A54C|nr:hypothetical protein [Gayadomonas joobiniege]
MVKSFFKDIFVSLVLLTFVGQTWADTQLPCEMMTSAQNTAMHQPMMDHKMHHEPAANKVNTHQSIFSRSSLNERSAVRSHDNHMSQDCCDLDCFCSANANSVKLIIDSQFSPVNQRGYVLAKVRSTTAQPNTIADGLYRPPIFA